jgi:hypothetical protein
MTSILPTPTLIIAIVGTVTLTTAFILKFVQFKKQNSTKHIHEIILQQGKVKEILKWSVDIGVLLIESNNNDSMIVVLKRRGLPEHFQTQPQLLLQQCHWELVTESGAEYSYFRVGGVDSFQLDVEVICPASEEIIRKYKPTKKRVLKLESLDDYLLTANQRKKPDWVQNIVSGLKEIDRVVYRSDPTINISHRFLLVPDTNKWLQFPKTSPTPYLLAFAEDSSLQSLRDLRGSLHIPLLQAIKTQGLNFLQEHSNISPQEVRVFFHYPPQFWWLHVHFCLLSDPRADVAVERAHLLDDVIINLQMDNEYYVKRTMVVVGLQ